MTDSFDNNPPTDHERELAELDKALNGEPFDVLAAQEIRPEQKVVNISDFSGMRKPTDIDPLPIKSKVLQFTGAPKPIERKNEEEYKPDPRLIAYALNLIRHGNKKLDSLKFDLDYVQSEPQLRQILENSLHLGHINEEEYEKMLSYLGTQDSAKTEKSVDDSVFSIDIKTPPKAKEITPTAEAYAVPKELVLYIRGLSKLNVGSKKILDVLENEKLSRDEVLTTLSDGFHHLKILSEDEYKKALEIMGETDEDIEKNIINKPKSFTVAAKTKKEDVISAIPPIAPIPTPSSAPIITPTPTPSSKSPEEIVSDELNTARSEYATQYIAWKNKVREKKWKITKIFNDLGVEKQVPESERPQELIDAEKAYILAKKNKAEFILGPVATRTLGISEQLFVQTEAEFNALQEKLLESIPPLEKGRIAKALEKWAKLPMPVRISITTTVMFGAGLALGTVAVAGAGATLAYRGARSFAGATLGQVAGAYAGKKMENSSVERTISAREKYGAEMEADLSNFEEKEKELMRFAEKEESQIKRNRLKKAGVMMAVGAGVNIGAGMLARNFGAGATEAVSLGKGASPEVLKPGLGPKSFDGVMRPAVSHEVVPTGTSAPEIPPIKVSLSSKGFLDDIHNLKENVLKQYGGDANKVPPEIRANILNRSSVEIAKEYGFYDPEKNLSAMGLKGESLGMDSHGHLIYEHAGKSDVLFDSKTGQIKTFESTGGKMFSPKINPDITPDTNTQPVENYDMSVKGGDPNYIDATQRMDLSHNTSEAAPVSMRGTGEYGVEAPSPSHIPYKNSFVNVENVTGKKLVMWNGSQIAAEQPYGGSKILVLDDHFQDGPQNAGIRGAFVEAFEKNVTADVVGEKPTAVPFEGGKIYIIQGLKSDPNGIKVLLNGKEIAKSVVKNGVSSGPKISLIDGPGIKSGWLFSDTVYERAFKAAKQIIKTLKINPQVTTK